MSQWMQRKANGICPRCGRAPSPDSVLCELHRIEAAARVKASTSKTRRANRANGRCAFCSSPSVAYRCETCKSRLSEWRKSASNAKPRNSNL